MVHSTQRVATDVQLLSNKSFSDGRVVDCSIRVFRLWQLYGSLPLVYHFDTPFL